MRQGVTAHGLSENRFARTFLRGIYTHAVYTYMYMSFAGDKGPFFSYFFFSDRLPFSVVSRTRTPVRCVYTITVVVFQNVFHFIYFSRKRAQVSRVRAHSYRSCYDVAHNAYRYNVIRECPRKI